jgi:hypothetical protein
MLESTRSASRDELKAAREQLLIERHRHEALTCKLPRIIVHSEDQAEINAEVDRQLAAHGLPPAEVFAQVRRPIFVCVIVAHNPPTESPSGQA